LNTVPGNYPSTKGTIAAKREPEFETGEYAAAGSLLHSNAQDLGKYLFEYVNGNSVISRKSSDLLWTRYIDFPGLAKEDGGDGKQYSYGLGWMISEIEGRTIIHHGGSTGKTSSFMMIDTANKIAAAILMNLDLTFIDKHKYPTGFQILNNVMRLASNLDVSDFGKPAKQDRTLNKYELSVDKEGRYTGEYIHSQGGDGVVYFGVDMSIRKTEEGQLESVIHRGRQVVNQFNLDFVNQSIAVSRNIYSPDYIKFRITPTGDITHVYFRNIEFRKKRADEGRVHELQGVYGSVTFRLPDAWTISLNKNVFSAANEQQTIFISGGETEEKTLSAEKYFIKSLPKLAQILAVSKEISENIGSLVWQQQAYSMKEGKVDYLRMLVSTRTATSGYWLMLSAPKNQFTVAVQEVLRPLLLSFRVR
jgi:hypothetical protein